MKMILILETKKLNKENLPPLNHNLGKDLKLRNKNYFKEKKIKNNHLISKVYKRV